MKFVWTAFLFVLFCACGSVTETKSALPEGWQKHESETFNIGIPSDFDILPPKGAGVSLLTKSKDETMHMSVGFIPYNEQLPSFVDYIKYTIDLYNNMNTKIEEKQSLESERIYLFKRDQDSLSISSLTRFIDGQEGVYSISYAGETETYRMEEANQVLASFVEQR